MKIQFKSWVFWICAPLAFCSFGLFAKDIESPVLNLDDSLSIYIRSLGTHSSGGGHVGFRSGGSVGRSSGVVSGSHVSPHWSGAGGHFGHARGRHRIGQGYYGQGYYGGYGYGNGSGYNDYANYPDYYSGDFDSEAPDVYPDEGDAAYVDQSDYYYQDQQYQNAPNICQPGQNPYGTEQCQS